MPALQNDPCAVYANLHELQVAESRLHAGRGRSGEERRRRRIMNSHDERERIKRAMGIGQYPGENDMLDYGPGETKTYIYAGKEKFSVVTRNDEFCTWRPGGFLCAETLEKLRDKVIAEIATPRPAEGQLIYIHGLGMVKVTFPAPSAPRGTP